MSQPLPPITEAWVDANIRPQFSKTSLRQEIYLANHSLGRPLDVMQHDVAEALNAWYQDMDEAWDLWFAEFQRFESSIKSLIEWPDQGAVVPKSNVGQGLRAILNSMPERQLHVIATRGEFDSVDFILKAYQAKGRIRVTWLEPLPGPIPTYSAESYLQAIQAGPVDLVVISVVLFATGQVMPELSKVVNAAKENGARVMLDTYHSAGIVPFDTAGADFAVGGCYKYLRGGPGACWLAIHPDRLADKTLDTGWFAKYEPFSYRRAETDDRAEGGMGWWESTPPVLPVFQARAGLAFTLGQSVVRLREFNLHQLSQIRERLAPFGGFTPEDAGAWGGYALLPHPEAGSITKVLKAHGVNTDSRHGFVRFGPDLLNTEAEFDQLGSKLEQAMKEVGA